jgi:hypothetical protein
MATVDGPLFSLEARGKIGDAVVYFPWKGRHVVRQWLKPTKVESTLTGYMRAAVKAIAKWVKKIGNTNDGDALDSVIYQAFTDTAPAGINWNAVAVEGFLSQIVSGGALVTTLFDNIVKDFSTTVGTAARTAFSTDATALGMENLTFDYGYITEISAGLQLYFGALSCYAKGIIGTAPYTIDPISWAASDVDNFKADHTTDV